MIDGLLWVEKHRPVELAGLALEEETRALLESYVESGEVPHLLLIGPAGSGKTTVARILCRHLDCRVLSLNASSDRGIDVVRDKIGSFITAQFGPRWNIVFLDEADAMTADAQTALRNLIENYSDRARFILSGNYGHKIIGPIHSRCQVLTMGRPPLKERYRILSGVLASEEIPSDPATMLSYAERYPDMREMLMKAQRSWLGSGKTKLGPAAEGKEAQGGDILEMIDSRNWVGLRRLCSSGAFDPTEGLRSLFWAVPDDHPRVGKLRHVVGRGVHESGFTPDPHVLFLAVCAEAMS